MSAYAPLCDAADAFALERGIKATTAINHLRDAIRQGRIRTRRRHGQTLYHVDDCIALARGFGRAPRQGGTA